MDQEELNAIATQLSHPSGEHGVEIGAIMNTSNIGMTLATIENLDLKDQEVILEIGHGNAGHLPQVLDQAKNLTYHGLELSRTMHEEAIRKNVGLQTDYNISFQLYSDIPFPYENNVFDKIMTVNTIYFMNNPVAFLTEIHRVMKPGGKAIITFAHKKFMKTLPFVTQLFRLYNPEDFEKAALESPLQLEKMLEDRDFPKTKTGESVTRFFCMAILQKV